MQGTLWLNAGRMQMYSVPLLISTSPSTRNKPPFCFIVVAQLVSEKLALYPWGKIFPTGVEFAHNKGICTYDSCYSCYFATLVS